MKTINKIFRQIVHDYPRVISFEPVSHCILDCEYCILKKLEWGKHREKVMMRFKDFKKVIDDIAYFTTKISFSGGEPLLNKELPPMLAYARLNNIHTLVATNAVFMDKYREEIIMSPADKLLVAYDPPSQGYNTLMLNSIRWIIEHRDELPKIILQVVLTKQNINRLSHFYQLATFLKVDYTSVKALGIWPEGDEEYDKLMIEKYIVPKSQHPISRHEIKDGKIIFFRKPGQCPAVKHAYIRSDGGISPCWYWVNAGPIMGNAFKENFTDIWNSKKYKEYRHKMKYGWADLLCHRCIGVGAKRWLK